MKGIKKIKTIIFGEEGRIKKNLILSISVLGFILIISLILNPIYEYEYNNYPDKEALGVELPDLPLFYTGIFGPIIEEHLFRLPLLVIFLLLFKNKTERKYKIILGTLVVMFSLLFAFAHIGNSGIYLLKTIFLHTFLFGIIFNCLAIKSESLLYPTIVHSLNNSLYFFTT